MEERWRQGHMLISSSCMRRQASERLHQERTAGGTSAPASLMLYQLLHHEACFRALASGHMLISASFMTRHASKRLHACGQTSSCMHEVEELSCTHACCMHACPRRLHS